jgi:hypothetical protein
MCTVALDGRDTARALRMVATGSAAYMTILS